MTPEEFQEGIALLFSTFPNIESGRIAARTWHILLKDMPGDVFKKAVIDVCREEKNIYPGTNVVALIRAKAMGDVDSMAIRALALLEEAMTKHGAYATPVFTDEAIAVAVYRVGGWEHICLMDLDEWKFVRKDFERIYKDLVTRGLPDEIPELIGTQDRMNQLSGHLEEAGRNRVVIGETGEMKKLAGGETDGKSGDTQD